MFNSKNLKIVFLALFLAGAMPVLSLADGKDRHMKYGTRVNTGAHADIINNGVTLRLVVQYQNPSNKPITVNEIKIYSPDGGTPLSPNTNFPVPFTLGPLQSKGFVLGGVGINPVSWPPVGVFQVHAKWESEQATNGLKSFSVIIANTLGGESSRHSIEGFDIKNKKSKDDDGSND
ncbi:MAG: hypothetical protein HON76_20775 [Candidatus Scalindua sp.]|nr:hypothetical protein [Candidatus Scalindua sp.]